MKKKYWKVGYSYYPHESLVSNSFIVKGTEQAAKLFIKIELFKEPMWVRNQVSKKFNDKKNHQCLFIDEIEIIEI